MAKPGRQQRLHPSRRHRDPLKTKNEKLRLGPLNIKQLQELVDKSQRKRDRAKYLKELIRKQAIFAKRSV